MENKTFKDITPQKRLLNNSEYKIYNLCEITSRLSSGKTISSTNVLKSGKYPVIGGNGKRGYTDSFNFEGECAVIGRQGAYCGNVRYFSGKAYMTEHAIVAVANSSNCIKYVSYYLSKMNLGSLSGQSAQPGISVHVLKRQKLRLPSYKKQEKIASILSAYDDLIENYSKRIKLLEQMAENLYKEWFVRFRFPGYENAEFENGIPKCWTIKRIQEFCYVTDGTHNSPKSVDIGIPLITGKCISNGFIDFNISYNISSLEHEAIKKRSGLKSGDIIFSNIGTVGNCCIIDYDREFSVKNVIIFKPKTMVETSYLYYWLTSSTMQEIFSTQTNGASQQFVGLNFMRKYKLIVPSNDILENFAKKIVPIINQKELLHKINLKLIKQRDLLLPRLMSGKLKVE